MPHDLPTPSRRTVLVGTAWAAPAIVVATAAPAYAASQTGTMTYLWSQSDYATGTGYVTVQLDPPSSDAALSLAFSGAAATAGTPVDAFGDGSLWDCPFTLTPVPHAPATPTVTIAVSAPGYSSAGASVSFTYSPGTVDSAFHATGPDQSVLGIAALPDGKLLVAGSFRNVDGVSANRIARLTADGALDPSFALPGAGPNRVVRAIARGADGKVYIGGDFSTYNGAPAPGLARLNADLTLDTTFTLGTGPNRSVTGLAVETDGKLLVAGDFDSIDGVPVRSLARLDTDGSVDASFPLRDLETDAQIYAVAIDAQGRYLVGGRFTTIGGVARDHVARVSATGEVDTGFVPGFSPALGETDLAYAVRPLANGQVLAATSSSYAKIARLETDGSRDGSFAPPYNLSANTVHEQSDGRIVAGGSMYDYLGPGTTVRLVRLLP